MNAKELGAMPVSHTQIQELVKGGQPGITLRQHFAGLAMQALLSRDSARPREASPEAEAEFCALGAKYAATHADALLAELAKDKP